jgi:hypothetical protein
MGCLDSTQTIDQGDTIADPPLHHSARCKALRANSCTVEVAAVSHSVNVSHTQEVADGIESAARGVLK